MPINKTNNFLKCFSSFKWSHNLAVTICNRTVNPRFPYFVTIWSKLSRFNLNHCLFLNQCFSTVGPRAHTKCAANVFPITFTYSYGEIGKYIQTCVHQPGDCCLKVVVNTGLTIHLASFNFYNVKKTSYFIRFVKFPCFWCAANYF